MSHAWKRETISRGRYAYFNQTTGRIIPARTLRIIIQRLMNFSDDMLSVSLSGLGVHPSAMCVNMATVASHVEKLGQ